MVVCSNIAWYISGTESNINKLFSLNLYPAVETVEKKRGVNFSIICTSEQTRYFRNKLNWFKDSGVLPNMTRVIRQPSSLRLEFVSLKLKDSDIYTCNITDDPNIRERQFELIVFGK